MTTSADAYYPSLSRGRPERCPRCDEFQIGYGYPWVDDPRDFSPDRECCTNAEIKAWERDVEIVKSGGQPEALPRGCGRSSYGIGVYWSPCSCEGGAAA